MAVEMKIWRMTEGGPVEMVASSLNQEKRLEDMLFEDPALTGLELLVLGRQVTTGYRGNIDLLALDVEGQVHVLELKRDRTPRDVVAQTLDYGSWVKDLSFDDLEQVYADHHGEGSSLKDAFVEHFDEALPESVNTDQQFTIVASELDPASDRIVAFLSEDYGVPINAVFFRHFEDGGNEYLARTWLIDPEVAEAKPSRAFRSKRTKAPKPWNGRDFYVGLGRLHSERWHIASKYGLLSGRNTVGRASSPGGGTWYWKPFRRLAPGHRVFAYVIGAGYVGVGRVTGTMIPAREAIVEIEGERRPLIKAPDISEKWKMEAALEDPDRAEMVVPVEWIAKRPKEQAFWESGLFAHQNNMACKLRDQKTIDAVLEEFGIKDE